MSSIRLHIHIDETLEEFAGWLGEVVSFDETPWLTQPLGLSWNGTEWLPESGERLWQWRGSITLFDKGFDLEPFARPPSGLLEDCDGESVRMIQYYTEGDIEWALANALRQGAAKVQISFKHLREPATPILRLV